MELTANVSGSNVTSFQYEWLVDGIRGAGIGALTQTYTLASADIGKPIRVKVTSLSQSHSSEIFSASESYAPTRTLTLTLKRHATIWGGKETGIIIERESGGSAPNLGAYWMTVPASGNLTTAGTTITLTSWMETKFRIRLEYTFLGEPFYFKLNNVSGSELFDLTNGTRTYTLQTFDAGFCLVTNLFAIEG